MVEILPATESAAATVERRAGALRSVRLDSEPCLPFLEQLPQLGEESAPRPAAVAEPLDPLDPLDHSPCLVHEHEPRTRERAGA